jgi:DNA-binding NarL/FixJ family response regulator
MNQITRVLIADDSAAVRADLITLLQLIDGIEVVGEAACGKCAVELTRSLHPDLVIIDLEMEKTKSGEMDGNLAVREIKTIHSAPKVFILTVHGYLSARQTALQTGADDFFIKGLDSARLVDCLRNMKKNEKNSR